MTKPEPLKGKVKTNQYGRFIGVEDIRSAVEWLKDEYGKDPVMKNHLLSLCLKLHEAFEDVMK